MATKPRRKPTLEGIDVRYTCGRVLWIVRAFSPHLEPPTADGVFVARYPCAACRLGLPLNEAHLLTE